MGTLTLAEFAQLAAAFGLLGLIWVVQLLVYPAFLHVPPAEFPHHHRTHTHRISWVVVPLLVAELASTLCLLRVPGGPNFTHQAGLTGCTAVAWLSTFLIQVPLHHRLRAGFDRSVLQRLIRTNWIRTAAWSIKALLAGLAYLAP